MYQKRVDAMRTLGISKPTFNRLMREVSDECRRCDNRYDEYAIAGNYVDIAVLIDWQKYREMLLSEETRDAVPPLNLQKIDNHLTNLTNI